MSATNPSDEESARAAGTDPPGRTLAAEIAARRPRFVLLTPRGS
ncbi:hypothetical protein [Streptomyces sp. NPDC058653]